MTTTQPAKFQDLKSFKLPANFRGRPAWYVQSWWIIQSTLFGCSPQMFYAWRRWLLRRFGAKIGEGVIIRPTARLTFPWKVTIGDHAWIGIHVAIVGNLSIGRGAVIGANAVVTRSIPDYCIAAGQPARVVRAYDDRPQAWGKIGSDDHLAEVLANWRTQPISFRTIVPPVPIYNGPTVTIQ